MAAGYYRHPTVFDKTVVFVSEDDLWQVPLDGGIARRLTSGRGQSSRPFFSPDGASIAFTGTEEGSTEIYVMDASGGPARQLTFLGSIGGTVGWTPDGEILFWSSHQQPFPRPQMLFAVPADGGEPRPYNVGPARCVTHQPEGVGIAIARNADDLAWWKRYRGGTAGVIWCTQNGDTWTRLFQDETAGFTHPMWVGERLYFLSDFEGYGNVYSSDFSGENIERHTNHEGFYARHAQTDGESIVYSRGGDIWRFVPATRENAALAIEYASPQTQMMRKFASAEEFIDSFCIHPKGHSLAITTRGKLFNFGLWEGGVRQNGRDQGVRYDMPNYISDDRLLVLSDESGEPRFEIHTIDGVESAVLDTQGFDIGRPVQVEVSPDLKSIAFANHRHELICCELETGACRMIESSRWSRINGFDWSADSRWIAYGVSESAHTSTLKCVDTTDWSIHRVTTGEFRDVEPCFDPEGRHLYFLSHRFFEPIYDQLFFEISFPTSIKPCVVTLRADLDSPFVQKPRPLDGELDEDGDDEESSEASENPEAKDGETEDSENPDKDPVEPVEIEFENIHLRVEAFPVPVGDYTQIACTDEKVFWTQNTVETPPEWGAQPAPGGRISYYALKDYETKMFAGEVFGFDLGPDRKTMAIWGEELRLVSASGPNGDNEAEIERPGRKSGIVDLSRVPVEVDRREEWRQMLREAWRLMRDHYWNPDMGGVDWDAVLALYMPLVDRVGARDEFSDLVRTMQGETGTSHAYEMGGDYRMPPQYRPAFLGADFEWDDTRSAYRITHLVRGDGWSHGYSSPLLRSGMDVRIGDHVLAVNGRPLDEHTSVQQRLVNLGNQEIEVVVEREGARRAITVRTLTSELPARYREWVNTNREAVHKATDGRVGYIHVPDMSVRGFAEFHRGYLTEARRDALIVDVRNNGGGHISQLLLEKLARKRIGYDISRWGAELPYPSDSILGPLIALTDEHAGSDGDIFSHCFKLMKLGPLVGKRTWGGVVGIWPRHMLVDGSITTQPEFSFWFEDVGFGVENYGTDPDIEVERSPESYRDNTDPQLERSIEVALQRIEETRPSIPEFGDYPRLAPPRLK